MSFSGGVYTLPGPALVTGEVVSATENNQFRNDVAGAFNLTMLRNGTSTATANLPMGGYKLTGLGAATTNGDALSYGAAAVVSNLTDAGLTATRVPYASTGGLLVDSANLTFNGTTLTANTLNLTNALGATYGGTGQASYAVGDILYASTTTALSKLADVATGNALISGGVGVAPAWGKIALTTHVSGTLPVANGGTGVTTSTGSGSVVLSTSPSLTTPLLGTPTSGTLTNCTGLPLTTGITGTLAVANGGTGVTTSTGTGNVVLSASPTLTGTLTAAAITASGTVTCNGALAANGGATLGNAAADALTITSNTATVNNTLTFAHDAATTNTVVDVVSVQRTSSGTPANGIGAGVAFKVETTASNIETGATIDAIVTDVTAGSEDFDLTFNTMTAGAAASEKMRINSSGNVGIGTSSPSYKLDVSGSILGSGDYIASSDAVFYSYNGGAGSGVVQAGIQMVGSGQNMRFYTASSERMRIDSGGNLLVGTTGTHGGAKFSVTSTNGYTMATYNTSDNYYPLRFLNTAGTVVGTIYSSASGTSFNTSSDYRLKENIQPMQNALAVVAQLNPVTYTWKADGSDGQGFIAHELQAVVPDCVTGEKDGTRIEEYEITPAVPAVYEEVVIPAVLDEEGNVVEAERTEQQLVTAEVPAVMGEREVPVYQGIDTSFLVATLTKAIQELAAKVDAQQAEIDALKNTAA